MKNKGLFIVAIVVIFMLAFSANAVLADPDPKVKVEEVGSPIVIAPDNEDIFNVSPRFRFTDYSAFGATKYRMDVWKGIDANGTLVYTFKGSGTCELGECWLEPTTPLKPLDYKGNGQYFWRIRAKVGGEWPPSWDQAPFRIFSQGFTSTFDLNYKKWLPMAGDWNVTSAGYLKTLGIYNTTATILQKEYFVDNIIYEATLKRKVEADSSVRLFFHGIPGSTYVDGYWEDCYIVQYSNDGNWSLVKSVDYVKTYLVDEEPTSVIIPYGWNKVTVWRHGSGISVWINEVYLGTYYDDTYHSGYIGLGVFETDAAKSPLLVDKAEVRYNDVPPYPIP